MIYNWKKQEGFNRVVREDFLEKGAFMIRLG